MACLLCLLKSLMENSRTAIKINFPNIFERLVFVRCFVVCKKMYQELEPNFA